VADESRFSDLAESAGAGWQSESAGKRGVQPVHVDSLTLADSPRVVRVDQAHVARLAECGAALPPIVVHRQTMQVIDGMHRLEVARRAGREVIEATFFDGSEGEAFALSVELNVKHGLPLSLAERKAAAQRILAVGTMLSDRAIAAKTGLSNKTVAAIRARLAEEIPHLDRRLGRDGNAYPVSGAAGRERAARLIMERPHTSLRGIAAAAGVSPGTVSDVRKRLAAGQDPAGGGRRPNPGSDPGATAKPAGRRTPSRQQGAAVRGRSTVSKQEILGQLRADPSIRGKAPGREVLCWLAHYAIDPCNLPALTKERIPLHQCPNIARLARYTAEVWLEFARALELLAQQADPSD
jgi:ParB-like chromosome segregation protein Spo0J